MNSHFYDPAFTLCSEKMPFTIRIEVNLKEAVDGASLRRAVEEGRRRYPHFAMRVVREGEDYLTKANDLPFVVRKGDAIPPLGGEEVNFHLFAVVYGEKTIHFLTSHVITDGGGFFPFLKHILCAYFSFRAGRNLSVPGVSFSDPPLGVEATAFPFPEEKLEQVTPLFVPKKKEFFRLGEGGLLTDSIPTVYRLRVPEKDILRFSHDNDGSPCALLSSLTAKAIRRLHPEETRDIVCAVSVNLRPVFGCPMNFRMLSSSLAVTYPKKLTDADITKCCTCTRGMITLRNQPENILWEAAERKKLIESLSSLSLAEKKAILGKRALEDATDNTFSVSYVGKNDLGEMEPYLDSIYNMTDASTKGAVFLEVMAVGGWFDVAFLQGFSSDVYYRAFCGQLTENGLTYLEEHSSPIDTPAILLPS